MGLSVSCATTGNNKKSGRESGFTLNGLLYKDVGQSREINSRWKVPLNGSRSAPVLHNGILYIGSLDGAIHAIDPNNGKELWRYQTGIGLIIGPEFIQSPGKSIGDMAGVALEAIKKKRTGRRKIYATVVIEDSTLYVGSQDHKFYALDVRTGKLKWATDIGWPTFDEPLLTKEYIIVSGIGMGKRYDAIYALRKTDGQVMWSTKGKGSVTYPFISGDKVYYVLSEDVYSSSIKELFFYMNAVEVKTGELLWTLELLGNRPKRVYGSENLVYVSAFGNGKLVPNARNNGFYAYYNTFIYAVNLSTGKLEWEFKGGDVNYHTPPELVIGSKYIYFTTMDGLYSVDKNTGEEEWFLPGKMSMHNITIDKLLYAHGRDGDKRLYAIDPKTGKEIWSYKDGNIFYIKVAGDRVYISAEKSLVALNVSTGKKIWKFSIGTNVSATPFLFKNHVIFPTNTNIIFGMDNIQGYLYSIDAHTGKIK